MFKKVGAKTQKRIRWDYKAGATLKGAPNNKALWEYCEGFDADYLVERFAANDLLITERSIERAVKLRVDKRDAVVETRAPRNARRGTVPPPPEPTARPAPPVAATTEPAAPPAKQVNLGLLGALVRKPAAVETPVAAAVTVAAAVAEQFPGGVPDGQWHMYEEDPVTWCHEKKPKIESKSGGRQDFVPYKWQEAPMRYFWHGGSYFVEKSRQEGFSTCILIAASHAMLYSLPVMGIPLKMPIVADKEKTALKLLKIVKLALYTAEMTDDERATLNYADPKSKSDIVECNVEEGERQGESWIGAYTSTGSSGRGEAFNAALLEEFAWADNAEAIWNSVRPVVTDVPTARVWLISTPNGATFHSDLCDNAEDFRATYLPMDWQACGAGRMPDGSDRDQAWRDQKDREMGKQLAAQEYDLQRLGAGDHLVDEDTVRAYAHGVTWWGPEPLPGHVYSKACDIAGPGQDKDVDTVIDVTTVPAQMVFQQHYPNQATKTKLRRIEALDQKWPGRLRIDATNNSTLAEDVKSRNKIAVRFRGEQDVTQKVDETTGMQWEQQPRERMSEALVRALESGSLVVHEKFFPDFWEAMRTAQFARKRLDTGKIESTQKAKRRGKNPDHWDSGMMAALEVKMAVRKLHRQQAQQASPLAGSNHTGRMLREKMATERQASRRVAGRSVRGRKF